VSVLWLYLFFISGRSGRCEPVQQDAGELQIATKTKQKWEKGEECECPRLPSRSGPSLAFCQRANPPDNNFRHLSAPSLRPGPNVSEMASRTG